MKNAPKHGKGSIAHLCGFLGVLELYVMHGFSSIIATISNLVVKVA